MDGRTEVFARMRLRCAVDAPAAEGMEWAQAPSVHAFEEDPMADSPTTEPRPEAPAGALHLPILGACGCGSGCGCGCQSGGSCQCGGSC